MWRNTDNSLRPRWRFLALILLPPLLALAQTAPPAQPFQRLDGCAYKPQRWDDGDSFHVILPDQKELIFRLYFVDTPEEERVYADRIAEQAAYFGISPKATVEVGRVFGSTLPVPLLRLGYCCSRSRRLVPEPRP
jgi:hypothetical protein